MGKENDKQQKDGNSWLDNLKSILEKQRDSVGESEINAPNIVNFNRTPDLEQNTFLDSEGFIFSFGHKFEDGFEGWKPGDRVNSKFVVKLNGSTVELLVADSVVGDIRYADTLYRVDSSSF